MLKALRRSPVFRAHLLLLAVVLVWGTTFTLVKEALAHISPLLFNFARMGLASAFLVIFNWRRLRHCTASEVKIGALAGVFLALGYQFQTTGLARTTPAKSAFITGLVVVLVPLLGIIPGVRPQGVPSARLNGLLGALVAFAGVVLLTAPSQSASLFSGIGTGELLTLACAFAFAGHLYTTARITERIDARRLGTIQIGAAALVMLFALPLEHHAYMQWDRAVFWALLVTSLFATAAAFTIQSWAQKHISPTHAALIFTMEPVFAWLTSLVLLHEHLSARSTEGAGLILAGILVSELWPVKAKRALVIPIEPTGT